MDVKSRKKYNERKDINVCGDEYAWTACCAWHAWCDECAWTAWRAWCAGRQMRLVLGLVLGLGAYAV